MTIYYQDDSVTLYHGEAADVLACFADRSVDAVITDPPYSARTHKNAKANSAAKGYAVKSITTFDSITEADLRKSLAVLGRITRRWVVADLDYRHAVAFDEDPPDGLRMLRVGVWVKTNPTPQISGDRPAQGWEAIAYMHRADLRPAWAGGGRHGNFISPIPPSEGHPTAKPLAMVRQWVQWFTRPGDLILDPYAGSGTTLRAAVDEGRHAIGVERNERYCEVIAKRLAQGVLDFGGEAS